MLFLWRTARTFSSSPPCIILVFRAHTLLDQYRKKSQLYQSNVVFAPIGDDFRFNTPEEWENQFRNYQALFEYMNSKTDWHVQVRVTHRGEDTVIVQMFSKTWLDSSTSTILKDT